MKIPAKVSTQFFTSFVTNLFKLAEIWTYEITENISNLLLYSIRITEQDKSIKHLKMICFIIEIADSIYSSSR